MKRVVSRVALLGLLGGLGPAGLLGCEEKIMTSTATGSAAESASADADAGAADAGAPPVPFQEADFVESDRSRDPFRSFTGSFQMEETGKVKSDRPVILSEYRVEELRLVGTVTRIQPPKAMFVDPTGRGHVVARGQFIGRAEVVEGSGTGADYEVNWRIQRIQPDDVVIVREDPTNPDVPAATRVLPLRTDVESAE